jgi:hypothetical protein
LLLPVFLKDRQENTGQENFYFFGEKQVAPLMLIAAEGQIKRLGEDAL